jgi:hypothetical protein
MRTANRRVSGNAAAMQVGKKDRLSNDYADKKVNKSQQMSDIGQQDCNKADQFLFV